MAQLTEDIQPCFETTLKSKAVSENCNVKFTCVVSGMSAVNSLVHLNLFMSVGVTKTLQIVCDVKRSENKTLKAPSHLYYS